MTTQLDIAKHIPADDPDGWDPERARWEREWAAAAHGTVLTELKFDPDQPRDDQGRWTSDGAEAPPTRELGTVAFGYSGEVVPGNTRIVWRNDTPKSVVDSVKAGLKFLRSKGDMRIGNVIIDPDDPAFQETPNAMAVTYGWGDSGHTEVRINPEAWQRNEANPTPGWFSSDSPNHTVVHENGHIVHRGQMTGNRPKAGNDLTPAQRAVAATVSRYATANSSEFMAETYAAKTLGEKVSPEAQSLYDAIQNRPLGGVVKEFNPDQPRDDQGRWTSDGGGESSTKPLEFEPRAFDSSHIDDVMIGLYNDWGGELSADERDALNDYSRGGFWDLNASLRAGTADDFPKIKEEADLIDQALARDTAATPEPLVAWRGLNGETLGEDLSGEPLGRDGLPNFQPGQVITDKGFVSTSMNMEVAAQFAGAVEWQPPGEETQFRSENAVLFKVSIPKGAHAGYVESATEGLKNEAELILPRQSSFRVTKVTENVELPFKPSPKNGIVDGTAVATLVEVELL